MLVELAQNERQMTPIASKMGRASSSCQQRPDTQPQIVRLAINCVQAGAMGPRPWIGASHIGLAREKSVWDDNYWLMLFWQGIPEDPQNHSPPS